MKNVLFISLGCDKNLVDSEKMLGLLNESGYTIVEDEAQADAIVINTCCFIHDAKEESIETILEMASWKERGRLKALVITGCLAERYKDEIAEALPEVDAVIGTTGYTRIVPVLDQLLEAQTADDGQDGAAADAGTGFQEKIRYRKDVRSFTARPSIFFPLPCRISGW